MYKRYAIFFSIFLMTATALICAQQKLIRYSTDFFEFAIVVLSFTAFIFAFNAKHRFRDQAILAATVPLFCIALTQLLHLTVYIDHSPNLTDNRIAELGWVAGRLIETMVLIALSFSCMGQSKPGYFLLRYGVPALIIIVAFPIGFLYKGIDSKTYSDVLVIISTVNAMTISPALAYLIFSMRRKKGKSVWMIVATSSAIASECLLTDTYGSRYYLAGLLFRICTWYGIIKTIVRSGFIMPYERLIKNLTIVREAERATRRRAEIRAGELEALRANMNDMLSEHDSSKLFSAILSRAVKLLDVSGGELALIDKRSNEVVIAASSFTESVVGTHLNAGEGVLGMVAEKKQPVILHGFGIGQARLPRYPLDQWYSLMAVPLLIGSEIVGTMMITETNPVREFTKADMHLFNLFAQQAAIAIWNTQLLEEAQHKADTDSLTGLYNHGTFFSLASNEIDRAQRYNHALSALMIDIDFFKQVNDTFGHAAGDQVLVAVAQLCRKHFRKVDIVGRYGGEEFSVMLPETELDLACQAAERFRTAIASLQIITSSNVIKITISVGVATLNKRCFSVNQLLEHADEALYMAKHLGRNRLCLWRPAIQKGKVRISTGNLV